MNAGLTAGAARIDITPPLTIPYLGFVPRHAFFEGVHDPLYARAVVVGDCLYLQGAAGDINPLRGTTDFADVRRYGLLLAGEVLKQIAALSAPDYTVTPPCLRAASKVISLPSRELPPLSEVLEAHRQGEEVVRQAGSEDERRRAERALLGLTERLERVRRGDAPVRAEVQALRVGDAALVGIPGEPFAEMGLALKRISPTALCLGYANGYLGYLAPASAWAQGGYEVSLGAWSIVGPQAFDLLLDAAKSLVEEVWKA